MPVDEPGLFDLPDDVPAPPRPDRSLRGRRREAWRRTVTAEVTMIDVEALKAELLREHENSVTIHLVDDPEPPEHDVAAAVAALPAFDALVWLVWPTAGLEEAIEADAMQVLMVRCEASDVSESRGLLMWQATVELRDVSALRQIASDRKPDAVALIREHLAEAWNHATDPFAPIRSIPGISWKPGEVVVQHIPAREVWAR